MRLSSAERKKPHLARLEPWRLHTADAMTVASARAWRAAVQPLRDASR